jgi:small subunit ribosomal protein S20
MPNTKSAQKRLRQNEFRRARNRAAKSAVRTQLRKVREAAAAGDVEKAEQEYRRAAHALDRAGQKGIIHRNKASRTKSRLQRLIKAAKQAPAGE